MRRLEARTEGYVKVWRSLYEDRDFEVHPRAREVFLFLIVFAEWRDTHAMFRGKHQLIRRGQLILGYRKIAEKLDLPLSTIQRNIKVLIDMKRIQVDSDAHGTLFTVCNYSKYQDNSTEAGVSRNSDAYTDAYTNANTDEYHQVRREESKKGRREELAATESPDATRREAPFDAPPSEIVVEPELGGETEIQGEGTLGGENTGESGDNSQLTLLPNTPSVPETTENDEEKQRRIDMAQWRAGVYAWSKIRYIEAGLDPALYPKLDEKLSGRLRTMIEKLGWGNMRAGAQRLVRAIMVNGDWYRQIDSESGEERVDKFWFPTLNAMLTNDKIARLMPEVDSCEWDSEIAFQAKEFAANAKKLLAEAEAWYAESHQPMDVGPRLIESKSEH